jgi:hypothetical protein
LPTHGAKIELSSPGVYELKPDPGSAPATGYTHMQIAVNFAGTGLK